MTYSGKCFSCDLFQIHYLREGQGTKDDIEMQNVPIPSIFDNHGVWAEMRDLGLGWGPDRSSLTCFQEL